MMTAVPTATGTAPGPGWYPVQLYSCTAVLQYGVLSTVTTIQQPYVVLVRVRLYEYGTVHVCMSHDLDLSALNEPLRGRECLDEPPSPEMQYVHYFYSKLWAAVYEKPRFKYSGRWLDLVMTQVGGP
eukprot:SAG22_NODE_104_length_20159_cov_5.877517_14_plen_127_part_00